MGGIRLVVGPALPCWWAHRCPRGHVGNKLSLSANHANDKSTSVAICTGLGSLIADDVAAGDDVCIVVNCTPQWYGRALLHVAPILSYVLNCPGGLLTFALALAICATAT